MSITWVVRSSASYWSSSPSWWSSAENKLPQVKKKLLSQARLSLGLFILKETSDLWYMQGLCILITCTVTVIAFQNRRNICRQTTTWISEKGSIILNLETISVQPDTYVEFWPKLLFSRCPGKPWVKPTVCCLNLFAHNVAVEKYLYCICAFG